MATRNPEVEEKYKTQSTVATDHDARLPKGFHPAAMPSEIKFSFVFPSRDRQDLLKKLIDSLIKNTSKINEIEVLIAVDNDDMKTSDFLAALNLSFVKIFHVARSLNFSRDYYTFLAKQSKGRWIITINDDCVCETPSWDTIAYEILKDKPSVIYGRIEDGLDGFRANGHGNYSCFPLQGRGGFEALGWIFPERIPVWGADIHIRNLYLQVDSVVNIPIMFRHYSHHNKLRIQDDINKNVAKISAKSPFDMRPTYEEINKLIEAMKKEMVKV